ncbi:MAG: hypothetical protein ACRCX2_14050 [Paraclostridium sp.]
MIKNKEKRVEDYIMAKASRVGKRGRKGMQVTEEILNDLMEIDKDEFMKKYRCTEVAYLKLYYDFTSFCADEDGKEPIQVEVKEEVEQKSEIGVSDDFFRGIFPNVEVLYEKGLSKYKEMMRENQSKYDSEIADIMHKIELCDVSQPEKIALFDMMKEARINRRIWNNAYEFLIDNNHSNNNKVVDHINLRKIVDNFVNKMNNRTYKTRVLGQELGETIKKEVK